MRARWSWALGACALVLLACGEKGHGEAGAALREGAALAPGSGAALPGEPGPEGALCKTHGVLAAVCTKCIPALIPVFQAKGDWCVEHGFAESFCPQCHPERGGKPLGDVSADSAPADGTRVRFKSKETAAAAGLAFARVVLRQSQSELTVTAKIAYDAAKVAEVNARSAGVVQAIRAEVGAQVRVGVPLASIESAEVGADQSRLVLARSRVQIHQANYGRMKQLQEEGIAAEKQVLAARQELELAQAEESVAKAALGMIGGTSGASRYTLNAPISGVVTARNATIGRMVDTELVLFQIVDTSTMWAEIDIPERDVARVLVGQNVRVSVDGLMKREFTGELSYISPEIDAHTRTARGRVALDNPDGALRGNMFARAQLTVSAPGNVSVVPRRALQRAKDAHLVFVRLAVDVFEARRVEVGPGDGDVVEVTGRLAAGEEVVTEGSFLLKTETLKGSIGAGCCDVEAKK